MTVETEDERDAREWIELARRGDFESAWMVSDRILERHTARPDFARPRHVQSIWTGESLHARRVLVRCYHGLGDTIQFIRYVPSLRAIAREVIVWAPPALLPLLQSVGGVDRLLPLHDGAPEVDYDVDVEVMELPFVFRTTLHTIPQRVPYLHAPASSLPGVRPRVGLVWRCGDWERHRSLPFDRIAPLLEIERFTWCSLQLGRRPQETHARLLDVSAPGVQDAAARIAALDLLITIDSMPAHLAGALGVPVWTLLLKDADWRWMETGETTPWYPTMRLFRQQRDGDWEDVIERVRVALARGIHLPPEGGSHTGDK